MDSNFALKFIEKFYKCCKMRLFRVIFKHYEKSTPQKFWIEKEEKYLVSSTLLQSDALTRYVPLQLTLSGAKKVCSSCQKSLS